MILITARRIALSLAVFLCYTQSAPAAQQELVLQAQTMDRSADPCTDFYQFANGKWLASSPVPADRSRYGAYDEVSERNQNELKAIVEAAMASDDQRPIARLVGAFYRSGMDEAAIEAAGISPLNGDLADIAAIADRNALLTVLARQTRKGLSPLFMFYIDQDARNTQRYIPQLIQGGLGLPDRDYYVKTDTKSKELRVKYLAHVAHMFELMGTAPGQAQRDAASVMAVETRLARASMTNV